MHITTTDLDPSWQQSDGRPTARLWPTLSDLWMRWERRHVEQELRWLGHEGLQEDYRLARRG